MDELLAIPLFLAVPKGSCSRGSKFCYTLHNSSLYMGNHLQGSFPVFPVCIRIFFLLRRKHLCADNRGSFLAYPSKKSFYFASPPLTFGLISGVSFLGVAATSFCFSLSSAISEPFSLPTISLSPLVLASYLSASSKTFSLES